MDRKIEIISMKKYYKQLIDERFKYNEDYNMGKGVIKWRIQICKTS